ncbi:MAG: restriction endonuclease subunit S [Flavobacterium sp.]
MKPYEKYKESGVEWIGEIPEHWTGTPLKHISSITKGKKAKEDFQDYSEGLIPYLSMEFLRNQTDSPIYVNPNDNSIVLVEEKDLLILWDGSKAGEIVKAKKGALSSTMGKIHINNVNFDVEFITYLLKYSERFIQSNRIGMGIPHVDGEVLRDLLILKPTLQEQTAIAKYLDHQTAIIDELIEKKTKQIALLKEKRQAIINEAVTKGLDPTAKMKDSGLDSFGQIPENWILTKLKFLSKVKGRIGFRGYTTNDLVEEGEGALTLGATHITWEGDIDLSNPVFISWEKYEESPEIKLNKGDIVIVQRGSTCGKVAIISEEIGYATINPSLVILKEVNANPFYVFLSIKAALEALVNLTRSAAIPMLSQEQIGNLQIVLPPLEEQDRIAEYLNKVKIKFEYAIKQCSDSIEKLKEYRQSLISEAVTGKIDVRGWQKN